MTDDDVLSLHVNAVRQRSLVLGDASATQQRIVASLRARRRRKQRTLRSLICAGLVLSVGSTSYALIHGLPAALRPLLSSIGLAVKPPNERAAPRRRSPDVKPSVAAPAMGTAPTAPPASPVPPPPLMRASHSSELDAPPPRAAPAHESSERSSHPARVRNARAVAAVSPEPAQITGPVESAEELSRRLYARAHELHFVAREPEAALRAWDDYLAQAPLQWLRIEAEYNRALCLVRLGRTEEAQRELAPFADGTHGAYRRREAAALVRALELNKPALRPAQSTRDIPPL